MLNHFEQTEGTTGPAHDPYGYSELTFTNLNDESAILHDGGLLGMYFEGPDHVKHEAFKEGDRSAIDLFETFVGLDIKTIEKVVERIEHPSRCTKCRSKQFEDIEGFPGETFTRCAKCGEMLEYNFNEASVR